MLVELAVVGGADVMRADDVFHGPLETEYLLGMITLEAARDVVGCHEGVDAGELYSSRQEDELVVPVKVLEGAELVVLGSSKPEVVEGAGVSLPDTAKLVELADRRGVEVLEIFAVLSELDVTVELALPVRILGDVELVVLSSSRVEDVDGADVSLAETAVLVALDRRAVDALEVLVVPSELNAMVMFDIVDLVKAEVDAGTAMVVESALVELTDSEASLLDKTELTVLGMVELADD